MKNNYFKSDKMVETKTTNVYWGQKLLCTFRHTGKRNLNSRKMKEDYIFCCFCF